MNYKSKKNNLMLNSITWGQYFSTLAFLLIFYYLYTGYRYYIWEILGIIGIKKVDENNNVKTLSSDFKNLMIAENPEDYLPKTALEIDTLILDPSFKDEINAYLKEVEFNKLQKKELLKSLQVIALKYPALRNSDHKLELLHSVVTEVNRYFPNLLLEDEINQLLN
jgi:hypothetical protein